MPKLKRYLGAAMAMALLIIGFYNTGPSRYYKNADHLTFLDNTVLGAIASKNTDEIYLWKWATHYFKSCEPFSRSSTNAYQVTELCGGNAYMYRYLALAHRDEIISIEPRFFEEAAEVFPVPMEGSKSPENIAREKLLGTALAKYLDSRTKVLAVHLYIYHAAFLGLVILMFLVRQQVGSVILFPVTILKHAIGGVSETAKKIHEKI